MYFVWQSHCSHGWSVSIPLVCENGVKIYHTNKILSKISIMSVNYLLYVIITHKIIILIVSCTPYTIVC